MFKRIYRRLKEAGIDVYSSGQHAGICRTPYVVIRDGGQRAFLASLLCGTVEILAYFPAERFSEMDGFVREVKEALKKLAFLKPTGDETPVFLDERKRAYSTGIAYQIYRAKGDGYGF
ncbi:MAG: hypothetical protein FWC55_08835 [Firmicutes bacterium]|nr:hypothetical protein [Bacillota bacterium]